jgi:hypothetical protein
MRLVVATYDHFAEAPHRFEECAARLWQMTAPPGTTYDVTRPSRDGGRDAIGRVSLGPLTDPIHLDYALEAKCYAMSNAVGVHETSRLISRIRHRQFGVMVTTSYVGEQAYEEIRQDEHPILILAAADIANVLRTHQLGSQDSVREWRVKEFPVS